MNDIMLKYLKKMPQLRIKEVTFKNFRSFGNTETRIGLYNKGPLLIIGSVDDDQTAGKSNGAGKSTIAEAILWCLFGRLSRKDRPADNVINWFTKNDCEVTIYTEDGYQITRTRGTKNDLLIIEPNGKDISDSITKNAQKHLNQLFNLDYGIFAASVFFGQFNDSFLESPDGRRRKTLERLLGLLKFDYYAAVAKEEIATFELEQAKHTGIVTQLEREVLRVSQQIEKHNDDKATFETQRKERITQIQSRLAGIDERSAAKAKALGESLRITQTELTAIKLYDIDKLRKLWREHDERLQAIASVSYQIDELHTAISSLETEKQTLANIKREDISKNLLTLTEELTKAEDEFNQAPDGNQQEIEAGWNKYHSDLQSLNGPRAEIITLNNDINKLTAEHDVLTEEIQKVKKTAGLMCPTCKQTIPKQHVHTLSNPLEERLTKIDEKIEELTTLGAKATASIQKKSERIEAKKPTTTTNEARLINENKQAKRDEIEAIKARITETNEWISKSTESEKQRANRITAIRAEISCKHDEIKEVEEKKTKLAQEIEKFKPAVTVKEAQLIKNQFDTKQREIVGVETAIKECRLQKEMEKDEIRKTVTQIQNEANPYEDIINDLKAELAGIRQNRTDADEKVDQYNTVIKHLEYIRTTYADKKRLKAHILSKYIPYFNERIAYYLDAFDCSRYKLEFNSFLQTKTDRWPYEFWSGGECKRIDLAIMFAMYDLHSTIHGQSCNVLVFDEVDSRLDRHGVQLFANLIFKDFATQDKTIIVISHKDELRDLFPSKILIKKLDECSAVEEIR